MLLSVHSFSPVLGGEWRPWPVSVAGWHDRRLADRMLQALRLRGDLLVGDNQPYRVDDVHDYTLPTHGEGRGIPCVMIEIRQDGLATPADIQGRVERLAGACGDLAADAAGLFLCP